MQFYLRIKAPVRIPADIDALSKLHMVQPYIMQLPTSVLHAFRRDYNPLWATKFTALALYKYFNCRKKIINCGNEIACLPVYTINDDINAIFNHRVRDNLPPLLSAGN